MKIDDDVYVSVLLSSSTLIIPHVSTFQDHTSIFLNFQTMMHLPYSPPFSTILRIYPLDVVTQMVMLSISSSPSQDVPMPNIPTSSTLAITVQDAPFPIASLPMKPVPYIAPIQATLVTRVDLVLALVLG